MSDAIGSCRAVVFPGAGTSVQHPSMQALGGAFSRRGAEVELVDFPYRRAGRRAPDRPGVLVAAVREAVGTRDGSGKRLVVGGRSMGGRIASIAVAGPGPGAVDDETALDADGLVLVSYPLHPPGRPERLRVEHLGRIRVPTLVVQGTRDPFGTAEDCRRYFEPVGAQMSVAAVEGGRHGLDREADQVEEILRAWWSRVMVTT